MGCACVAVQSKGSLSKEDAFALMTKMMTLKKMEYPDQGMCADPEILVIRKFSIYTTDKNNFFRFFFPADPARHQRIETSAKKKRKRNGVRTRLSNAIPPDKVSTKT